MKIKVTKQDIKNGKPHKIRLCPIALCIKRAFKTNRVRVFGSDASIDGNPYTIIGGYEFVNRFDNGEKVKPRTFSVQKDF